MLLLNSPMASLCLSSAHLSFPTTYPPSMLSLILASLFFSGFSSELLCHLNNLFSLPHQPTYIFLSIYESLQILSYLHIFLFMFLSLYTLSLFTPVLWESTGFLATHSTHIILICTSLSLILSFPWPFNIPVTLSITTHPLTTINLFFSSYTNLPSLCLNSLLSLFPFL